MIKTWLYVDCTNGDDTKSDLIRIFPKAREEVVLGLITAAKASESNTMSFFSVVEALSVDPSWEPRGSIKLIDSTTIRYCFVQKLIEHIDLKA